MLIKILKIGVSTKGKDIPIGEHVETDEASARALIADGYAEAVAENAFKSLTQNPNPEENKLPAEGEGKQIGANVASQTGTNEGAGTGTEDGKKVDGNNDPGNQDPDAEAQKAAEAAKQAEELAKTKKALDGQYKRDELYDAAIKAGVEIAYDAKKAEIIDAVIAQKKADALLIKG